MLSPTHFDGYFKIGLWSNSSWWIGYSLADFSPLSSIYFYSNSWHSTMMDYPAISNYFRSKKAALEAFFKEYPDSEIVDESQKIHVILNKDCINDQE